MWVCMAERNDAYTCKMRVRVRGEECKVMHAYTNEIRRGEMRWDEWGDTIHSHFNIDVLWTSDDKEDEDDEYVLNVTTNVGWWRWRDEENPPKDQTRKTKEAQRKLSESNTKAISINEWVSVYNDVMGLDGCECAERCQMNGEMNVRVNVMWKWKYECGVKCKEGYCPRCGVGADPLEVYSEQL